MIPDHDPDDRESMLAWKAWWALDDLARWIWDRYEKAFVAYCMEETTEPDDLDEFLEQSEEDEIPF